MMPSGARTIGRLAKDAGVSVETIRYYERKGLIEQPSKVDGRYREYSDDLLAQVRYIKIAQGLGFSLSDVHKLKGEMTTKRNFCGAVENTVRQKLITIDRQLESLLRLKADLLSFQTRCSKRSSDDCPLYEELSKLGVVIGQSRTRS